MCQLIVGVVTWLSKCCHSTLLAGLASDIYGRSHARCSVLTHACAAFLPGEGRALPRIANKLRNAANGARAVKALCKPWMLGPRPASIATPPLPPLYAGGLYFILLSSLPAGYPQ